MAKDVNRVAQWLKEVERASSWPFRIHPRLQSRPRHFPSLRRREKIHKRKNSKNYFRKLSKKKIVENCRKIEIARKHRKYKEMMKIKIIDTGGCPIMPKGVKMDKHILHLYYNKTNIDVLN